MLQEFANTGESMQFTALPVQTSAAGYRKQADDLLESWQTGAEGALRFFHEYLPRLRDSRIPWMPQRLTDEDLRAMRFDVEDAQNAVARAYDFADWHALDKFAAAIERRDCDVYPFECAVDAVVDGDLEKLGELLRRHPDLTGARSTRVTHFDPPVHRATLLHYVAANGTENYRQRSPQNAVEIATALLDAGADVNSLASLYGGQSTTLSLLVSSCHPAAAGVQVPLVHLLASRGAALTDTGSGNWVSPVETALVFGYRDAACALVERGAPLTFVSAAGLGYVDRMRSLLPPADAPARLRALAIAATAGQVEATRLLLDAGEDPNRFNPPGTHSHSTPLHQAVWGGHLEVVRLLVERGARVDIRDTTFDATALGWAQYGGKVEVAAYLESIGAP